MSNGKFSTQNYVDWENGYQALVGFLGLIYSRLCHGSMTFILMVVYRIHELLVKVIVTDVVRMYQVSITKKVSLTNIFGWMPEKNMLALVE